MGSKDGDGRWSKAASSNWRWRFLVLLQVADLLVKLYKEPSSSTSKHLMHSYDGGKSGAIAQVFTSMGSSLKGASRFFLDDLLDRLLMLFLDFALKMAAPKVSVTLPVDGFSAPGTYCFPCPAFRTFYGNLQAP